MVETCTTLTPPIHILLSIMPSKGFLRGYGVEIYPLCGAACACGRFGGRQTRTTHAHAIEDERAIFNLI